MTFIGLVWLECVLQKLICIDRYVAGATHPEDGQIHTTIRHSTWLSRSLLRPFGWHCVRALLLFQYRYSDDDYRTPTCPFGRARLLVVSHGLSALV